MYLKLLKNKDYLNKNNIEVKNGAVYNIVQKNRLKKKIIHIYVTTSIRGFYINILNSKGEVLKHLTAGKVGYKKALRYNLVSLQTLINEVFIFLKNLNLGYRKLCIFIILKGFNTRRNKFVRTLVKALSPFKRSIISITDITGLPYNGCRPKKLRRK